MHCSVACTESHQHRFIGRNLYAGHPGSSVLPAGVWPNVGSTLRLSPRELQVVRGVFEDHKEEAIAFDLGISPHTVNTYFQRLYSKLGVSSRTQLILCVMAAYLALGSGVQTVDESAPV